MLLTEGSIELIYDAKTTNELPLEPVLQIMSLKPVQGSGNKLRAAVSDGRHFLSNFVLSSAVYDLYSKGDLFALSVVRLLKYAIAYNNNRKFYIVLELLVLPSDKQVHAPIGNPQDLNAERSTKPVTQERENVLLNIQQPKPSVKPQERPKPSETSLGKRSTSSGTYTGAVVVPIKALTPYQNKWTIRARVTSKASVRTYQNSRGEGKLFSVTFSDESGEIRATAFNDAVDAFYALLEPRKIFFISNGVLKVANKQFSSVQNEYEMTLNSDAVIKPCFDAVDLPMQTYNFVPISDIARLSKDQVVDILGIVLSSSGAQTITAKSGSRQLCKRDITIGDETTSSVVFTVWGEDADSDRLSAAGTLLAVKGAKVSDFNGRSLTTHGSTMIEKDPDIIETHRLSEWYQAEESFVTFTPISAPNISDRESLVLLHQLGSSVPSSGKSEYVHVMGMLEHIKTENIVYKACPTPNCNKKVVEDGSNYRCEKCNQSFASYSPRLLGQGKIVDSTSFQWVTFFNDVVEKMTDSNAKEVDSALQTDRIVFDEIMARPRFKRFVFKLKLGLDTFNDETRIRCTCFDLRPLNFVTDGRSLLNRIKQL